MATIALERRVDRLEDAMAEMARESARTLRVVAQTSRELADFKNEMADFKNEMADFKTEMRRSWGELSNRLGTMAEDLVAPSVPRVLRTVLGCPDDRIEQVAVRVRRRSSLESSRNREFDVIASCDNYFLINETKSRLSPKDVNNFVENLSSVREFFPEAAEQHIVGVIASLYVDENVDESLVRFAERSGLIVLGFGQDVMDVLNTPDFSPRFF